MSFSYKAMSGYKYLGSGVGILEIQDSTLKPKSYMRVLEICHARVCLYGLRGLRLQDFGLRITEPVP